MNRVSTVRRNCAVAIWLVASLACGAAPARAQDRASRGSAFAVAPLIEFGADVGGPELYRYGNFDVLGLDDAGAVAMAGFRWSDDLTEASQGIYLVSPSGGFQEILRAPGNSGLLGDSRPSLNEAGKIVFRRRVEERNGIPSAPTLTAYENGTLTDLLGAGDLVGPKTVVRDFSAVQGINERGDVALTVMGVFDDRLDDNNVFVVSDGQLRRVASQGEPTPIGGVYKLNAGPPPPVWIANDGTVLFPALIDGGAYDGRVGYFRETPAGVEKVLVGGDELPGGQTIVADTSLSINMNRAGEIAFLAALEGGPAQSGIFLLSGGTTTKIVTDGDPSPIGGTFSTLFQGQLGDGNYYNLGEIAALDGAVVFKAPVRLADGKRRVGLFFGSSRAVVKIVATGDRLPNGKIVTEIRQIAINDHNQVAFNVETRREATGVYTEGTYLAAPAAPAITSVRLKVKGVSPTLLVSGTGFVANDAEIEIDGTTLAEVTYPSKYREDGGTTRRVVSADTRLDDLVAPGGTAQVTVFNRLTGVRSAPFAFVREP